MTEVAAAAARVARAHRFTPDDPNAIADARRALAAAKIEAAIERALASAPALSPEQTQRVFALLIAAGHAEPPSEVVPGGR